MQPLRPWVFSVGGPRGALPTAVRWQVFGVARRGRSGRCGWVWLGVGHGLGGTLLDHRSILGAEVHRNVMLGPSRCLELRRVHQASWLTWGNHASLSKPDSSRPGGLTKRLDRLSRDGHSCLQSTVHMSSFGRPTYSSPPKHPQTGAKSKGI